MNEKTKQVAESRTIMTEIIMPNDTNPLDNLMGGNLMRWMDICAAVCAGRHCERHVVTASVDYVSFKRPIPMGDVVTLTACVTRAFNTSLEIFVEVFAANMKGGDQRKCNDAYFTFVALDEETKKPVHVPGVNPLTDSEEQRYESALQRRELRLILSGRMKPEEATNIRAMFMP
jgi:acyl-CoA hydrolase